MTDRGTYEYLDIQALGEITDVPFLPVRPLSATMYQVQVDGRWIPRPIESDEDLSEYVE